MKKLVTLWKRPSYDGKSFTYYLLYTDEQTIWWTVQGKQLLKLSAKSVASAFEF